MKTALTRQQAWHAFEKEANNIRQGTQNLELIRHARVFSTAPPNKQKTWEILIHAAEKMENPNAVREFGFALYNWANEHGYNP